MSDITDKDIKDCKDITIETMQNKIRENKL